MIITQKHPEDQACKTCTKHYGDNIPFPADHSDERNGADEDGERIHRVITWKDHVQAEPDGEIQHHADYRCGNGGQCRSQRFITAQFFNVRATQKDP